MVLSCGVGFGFDDKRIYFTIKLREHSILIIIGVSSQHGAKECAVCVPLNLLLVLPIYWLARILARRLDDIALSLN